MMGKVEISGEEGGEIMDMHTRGDVGFTKGKVYIPRNLVDLDTPMDITAFLVHFLDTLCVPLIGTLERWREMSLSSSYPIF